MSYAVKNWLEIFARWRESYLEAHPEKRLFPWLTNPLSIEDPPSPGGIITLGEKGKKIGALVALVAVLLLASHRE